MFKSKIILLFLLLFITSCSSVDVVIESETVPLPAVVIETEPESEPPPIETTTIIEETETTTIETTTVPETTTIQEVKTPKYITIPKFMDYSEDKAKKLFEDNDLKCSSVYEYTDYDKGMVYLFNFRGYQDDDNYYISPGTEITLHVSKGAYWFQYVNAFVEQEKVVYLTFDDGPNSIGTDRVLEILENYGIKATFFLVGQFASYYPNRVRAMYEAGHVIGCHSYSHVYQDIYKSEDSLMEDIKKWEAQIEKTLGEELPYKLYRFPGGTNNNYMSKSMRSYFVERLYNEGYKVFDWNVANNDTVLVKLSEEQSMEDYIKDTFVKTLAWVTRYSGVPKIILMHDTKEHTANALAWTIQYLIDNGYSFGTLDELNSGWVYQ